jgi:hypothetical protein
LQLDFAKQGVVFALVRVSPRGRDDLDRLGLTTLIGENRMEVGYFDGVLTPDQARHFIEAVKPFTCIATDDPRLKGN